MSGLAVVLDWFAEAYHKPEEREEHPMAKQLRFVFPGGVAIEYPHVSDEVAARIVNQMQKPKPTFVICGNPGGKQTWINIRHVLFVDIEPTEQSLGTV